MIALLLATVLIVQVPGFDGPHADALSDPPGTAGAVKAGYESVTKKELWETAERFKAKNETTREILSGCEQKLSVRTSTVINHLVVAPPAIAQVEGHSTELVILGVLAGVLFGGIVGALVSHNDPQTVVVR